MRRKLPLLILTLVAVTALAEKKPPTTEALQAEAQRLKIAADAATGERCAEVCLQAAVQLTELSNRNFTEGHVAAAHANMADAGRYAIKAAYESMESHKRQKKTEIGLRKLTARMKDIMQTLDFDDRPPIRQVMNSIEKARTDLLSSMFGNPKKSFEQPESKKEKR
jgi:hypothetical protein